jgi:ABC-2 type transport system permease protein
VRRRGRSTAFRYASLSHPFAGSLESLRLRPYNSPPMSTAPGVSLAPSGPAELPLRPAAPGLWVPALSLAKRELVRFLRQRHRVIGALATPIVFWLLIGGGMGRSFKVEGLPGGNDYLRFFFPGTIIMILLFTAIFSTISVIEDRREGFLQSVLVAPVPRMAIVLGKVLGGTALAFGQGLVFLLLSPLLGIRPSPAGWVLAIVIMLVVSFALTALGFCIAWRMSSTQGFHAIMNLFLMPMWFLSGALFPAAGAWGVLRWVMALNPLTYGLAGLRRAMYWGDPSVNAAAHLPGMGLSLVISVAFAATLFVLASLIARGTTAADLQ